MEIGAKLCELREANNFSQGDIEKLTGLFRCYTSRVENGYTVPSIGTLEKYANALGIPLYRFFTDEESVVELSSQGRTTARYGANEARSAAHFGNLRRCYPEWMSKTESCCSA